MKLSTIGTLAAVAAALAMALPASAQWQQNLLPGGEALPVFGGPSVLFSLPGHWTASVTEATTSPVAGLFTYWYKVTNNVGSTDLLTASSLAVNPANVAPASGLGAPVLDFGQWDPTLQAGGTAGQHMVSNPTLPFQTTINWQQNASYPTTGLGAGQTIYLWVRSTLPTGPIIMGLQDSANDHHDVPGPAPEPMSMALVGVGLSAVAGVRKKVRVA